MLTGFLHSTKSRHFGTHPLRKFQKDSKDDRLTGVNIAKELIFFSIAFAGVSFIMYHHQPGVRFMKYVRISHRKVDIRLLGKGNSKSHGARPVY